MDIKSLYKRYVNWVVIGLSLLFLVKSCQSGSRQRQIEWHKTQYEAKIDSLCGVIDSCQMHIDKQRDSINIYKVDLRGEVMYPGIYKVEVGMMKDNNEVLKGMNRHFQSTNKSLIDTNKKLTNKEE